MPKKIYQIRLNETDRQELEEFVKKGHKNARAINRVRILLMSNEKKTEQEIAQLLGVTRGTVHRVRKVYNEEGIESLLIEKQRLGRPWKVDDRLEAEITVIACSEPPDGRAKWTLRLIADKLVTSETIDSISHVTVGYI